MSVGENRQVLVQIAAAPTVGVAKRPRQTLKSLLLTLRKQLVNADSVTRISAIQIVDAHLGKCR